ncbi:MAG: recombinase RecT [Prevotella sp.]|nr:recombinase RecT [Prevotella sp.]
MNELSTVLTEELSLPNVIEALPTDFNRARFVQNCMALLNDNPDLVKKYPQEKLVPGLLKGAYLGLDFYNKECYLIPYGSDLNFVVDYKGLEKLVKKYSIRPVSEIYARVVREGDEFSESVVNNSPAITFKPVPFNTGKITGAFAVCQYADGGAKVETMSIQQLDAAKRMSKAQNSTAWKFFPEEMYKKIVIRRLCKGIQIDLSPAQQRVMMVEDDDVIDTTYTTEEVNPF